MTTVAEAFVTLRPDTDGFGRATEQQVEGELSGSSPGTAAPWLRRSLMGAIGLATVGAGTAISGGLQRSLDREEAIVRFRRIGLDEDNIAQLTDDIDQALRGTIVSNPEGFLLAGQLLEQGFDQADIPGFASTIADLAQVSGRSFEDVGNIFTIAAGQGRVTTQQLNQLQAAPLGRIAEELGLTQEGLRATVTAGDLTAEAFLNAFAAIDDFSGVARDETTRQAWANFRTAISRAGEALVGPTVAAGELQESVGVLRGAVEAFMPVWAAAGEVLGFVVPVIRTVAGWFMKALIPAIDQLVGWLDRLQEVNTVVWEAVQNAASRVTRWWDGTLKPAIDGLGERFRSAAEGMGLAWAVLWSAVRRLWNRFGQPAFDAVSSALGVLGDKVDETVGWFRDLPGRIVKAIGGVKDLLLDAGRDIIQGLWSGMTERWRSVSGWLGGLGGWIQRLKGPLAYDRTILLDAGRAVMGGFDTGLRDGWRQVEATLSERTDMLSGTFAGQQMAGGVTVHGGITVGSAADMTDLGFTLRKAAIQGAYG